MSIPVQLQALPNWVVWRLESRNGKTAKIPYCALTGQRASTTDPSTWCSYDYASRVKSQYSGLGIVLRDDLVGIDLDHVVSSDNVIEPWALEVLQRFASTYSEFSPSGHGLRIFCYGQAQRCGKGTIKKRIELYDRTSPRYLTVTGLGDDKPITAQPEALQWLHETYFAKAQQAQWEQQTISWSQVGVGSDAQVVDKARAAKGGDRFAALMAGNWQGVYPSQSEADSALCAILAFWCQGEEQVDRIMRSSGLMRPKWDAKHGDKTYGQRTVEAASGMVKARYNWDRPTVIANRRTNAPKGSDYVSQTEDSHLFHIEDNDMTKNISKGKNMIDENEINVNDLLKHWRDSGQDMGNIPPLPPPPGNVVKLVTKNKPGRPKLTATVALEELVEKYNLITTGNGKPVSNNANIRKIINDRFDNIKYNSFSQQVTVEGEPINDNIVTSVLGKMQDQDKVTWFRSQLEEELELMAEQNSYHPVRDYLNSLKWDGIPRVDRFATDVFGTQRNEWSSVFGRIWLISAIARIFNPGCQADYSLLIISEQQGTGKSSFGRILCGVDDWFSDDVGGDLHNKDSEIGLLGKWIIEMAEASRHNRTDKQTWRSYMSRSVSHIRLPYQKYAQDFRRQCVFYTTTNDPEPFSHNTEERRQLPVDAANGINLEYVRDSRDQIWAEAVALYKAGKRWWLDRDDIEAMHAEVHSHFSNGDALMDEISGYCNRVGGERLFVGTLIADMHLQPTKAMQDRIAKCLKALEWEKGKQLRSGIDRGKIPWYPKGSPLIT